MLSIISSILKFIHLFRCRIMHGYILFFFLESHGYILTRERLHVGCIRKTRVSGLETNMAN